MTSIRYMTESDTTVVVQIIADHHSVDARMAEQYYWMYFADPARVSSLREQSLVAVEDDVVRGVIGYCPDKYDWPGILWLNWFYVSRVFKGRGIGTQLLHNVIDAAREMKARKLYIDTSSDESYQEAVRLYERFGFKSEGTLVDYYEKGEHLMILGLTL